MCVAWGQEHYRTFDNKVYAFSGSCTYTLVRDCQLNSFTVNVRNDRHCQPSQQCKRELDLYQGDSKITFRLGASGPEVTWDGASLTVPTSRSGTVFQQIGRYLTVQSPLGFLIKWDGQESIFFRATDSLRGKTCGLCGVYDGNQANDFTMESGGTAPSEAAFGISWKKPEAGEAPCPDSSQQQTCPGAVASHATTQCAALLSDPAFDACRTAVDVTMYMEACKLDCCSHMSESCNCKSMEAYSRACMDRGIALHWRRNNRCPVACSGGKMFQECGSPCTLTCDNPKQVCTDSSCVDGCFCPPGTVEHEGACILADQCPCKHGGTTYLSGQSFAQDCNTCMCQGGTLTCTKNTCSKRCSAIGDPHYQTFDGTRFDFMGKCSYYLMYDDNFDIIVDNIQCGHGEFATCTKSVTIDINGMTIKMDHNHQLFVNGREVTQLPYEVPGLKIFMVSSLFMQAELSNGVTVLWDGRTRAYVTAPSSFMGHTQGLCGTFDNNQANDLMTREHIIENNPNRFGNSWQTHSSCPPVPEQLPPNPCDSNPQRQQQARDLCNQLRGAVFAACHDVEPVESYIEDCVYDMCACTENVHDCLCPTLGVYADTCATKGVKLSWRQQIPDCMIHCPGGQEYQVCGNPCERTCRNLAQGRDCQPLCVEGCNCPDGQALNEQGQCVSTIQCPCLFDGREFPAGYVTLKGAEMCTCVGVSWSCTRLTFGDNLPHTLQPLCPPNSVYKECISPCPRTCDNPQANSSTCGTESTAQQQKQQCQSGCECVEGFVLENNSCVNQTRCPCHHGGKDYYEGDIIAMDCNQCTCRSRKWVCESNDCPSTCSAIGDSHYTTFDGKEYQFQGLCDYVLVKSIVGVSPQFQVTIQNVACGTSGVTCSKTIEVTVGQPGTASFYKLQLVRGQSASPEAGSPFTVREVGEFVYIDTPFGMSIQWDKGTRVYIRLENQHRQHVEGLCGNFNGNQNDDFKGPHGGPAMVRETEFGDSWKLHDYCAPSLQVNDPCIRLPQRRPWAQKQCSIIASQLFAPCHPVVDHNKYMQRCVFDTCACNQGGDCECLCTAIAAYAHECANHGFPISWRTNDLCPLACEDCQTYNPCISPCPKKTCDNRLTYNQNCKEVENMCFEGCTLQPCPPGQVYTSLKEPVTCIPEAMCDTPACKLNGKTYREGERIYDPEVCNHDCEICNCRDGTVEHISYASCRSLVPNVGPNLVPSLMSVVTPPAVPPKHLAQVLITKRSTPCLEGQTYDTCMFTCDEACLSLRAHAPECMGTDTNNCVPGCRPLSALAVCAPGEKRLDAGTCVAENMCPCVKPDGSVARSFETWKNPEDLCSDCSCQGGLPLCTNHDPSCTLSPSARPSIRPGSETGTFCGWSSWMNVDSPNTGSGDVESLVALHSAFQLCEQPVSIQCRDVATLEAVSEGSSVRCDLSTGLTCNNAQHLLRGGCADYEVRVYCPCADTAATPAPEDHMPANSSPGQCVNQWSTWINRDNPAGDGDHELWTLEEMAAFCPGGRITDMECMTLTDTEYFSTGETATCSLEEGFTCLHTHNTPQRCSDYKIRYRCTCAPVNEGTTQKPGMQVGKCGWTTWLNGHTPSSAGEIESLRDLNHAPSTFCADQDITAIECRPVGNPAVDPTVLAAVTCDLRYDGVLCHHEDLPVGMTCPDYEVRFLCEPRGQDCTEHHTHTTLQPSTIRPHHVITNHTVPQTVPIYPVCKRGGMEEEVALEVTNGQLTQSSSLSAYTDASQSRLHNTQDGLHSGGWVARMDDTDQWLQVSFPQPMTVTGLVTQGRDSTSHWVTAYELMFSLDGHIYHYYQEEHNGASTVFRANTDSSTEVRQMIQPTTGRYFVVKPTSWHGAVAMRLGLLGCQASVVPTAIPDAVPHVRPSMLQTPDIPEVCQENMGLMNGQIRDDMLRASSFRDIAHGPQNARLGGKSSWLPARDDVSQFLQVDLLTPHYITGVTTQGRPAVPSFVKTYRLLYSDDGVNWNIYREQREQDKIFQANRDSVTPVTNLFRQPIFTRYIRINPLSWEGRIALRMELLGCFQSYHPGNGVPTAIPLAQPTATPNIINVPDGCIAWDKWVDTHQPGLLSRDDFEHIDLVRAESQMCTDPLTIQCRTATTDHTPWQSTGQLVRCDLWTGLLCNADDVEGPSCFNYQVRLGCLKNTPHCLASVPTALPTAQLHSDLVPACYPTVDRRSCPLTCPQGQYCDGVKCVPRSECPCTLQGKIIRARDVATNDQCETCQCLNGEIRCVAKTCTFCPAGQAQLNSSTCNCECMTCRIEEFQCSTGSCLPHSLLCDGVIHCQDDELDCANPPKFMVPTIQPSTQPEGVWPDLVFPEAVPDHTPDPRLPEGCPEHCPKPQNIPCPANVQVVEILNHCNCTMLACLAAPLPGSTSTPNPVCRYRYSGQPEREYQIGDTWTEGVCGDCVCVAGSDGSGQVSCQRQQCATCKTGERQVDVPQECCGHCERAGCSFSNRIYQEGEEMPPTRSCYRQSCERGADGAFVVRELSLPCTPLNMLPPCAEDQERYDSDGCCLVCVPRTLMTNSTEYCGTCSMQPVFQSLQDSVSFFRVLNPLGFPCTNPSPLPALTHCAGQCDSGATYRQLLEGRVNATCSCCQPIRESQHHVTLMCQDGSSLEHSYTVAEACQCGACQGPGQ